MIGGGVGPRELLAGYGGVAPRDTGGGGGNGRDAIDLTKKMTGLEKEETTCNCK